MNRDEKNIFLGSENLDIHFLFDNKYTIKNLSKIGA